MHRYFFERESQYFAKAFSEATPTGHIPRGSSESNPFPLDNVSALDFTRFLWVFYNPSVIHVALLPPGAIHLAKCSRPISLSAR